MNRIALALLLLAACLQAAAQAPKYAVLSLLGDELLIVEREMSTGSRVDRNRRQFLPLPDPALDRTVVFAIEDELKRARPGAQVALLGARDPALFQAQSRLLEEGADVQGLLEPLRPVLARTNATHLLLVAKHRAPARLRMEDGSVGSGWLQGLGFYLEPSAGTINRGTGEASQGFIAPFAYFRVAMVDLASNRVVREERITASHVVADQKSVTPWGAMSAEDKVRMLRYLIREETGRVVPLLLP